LRGLASKAKAEAPDSAGSTNSAEWPAPVIHWHCRHWQKIIIAALIAMIAVCKNIFSNKNTADFYKVWHMP
jgi:hypothetical protein